MMNIRMLSLIGVSPRDVATDLLSTIKSCCVSEMSFERRGKSSAAWVARVADISLVTGKFLLFDYRGPSELIASTPCDVTAFVKACSHASAGIFSVILDGYHDFTIVCFHDASEETNSSRKLVKYRNNSFGSALLLGGEVGSAHGVCFVASCDAKVLVKALCQDDDDVIIVFDTDRLMLSAERAVRIEESESGRVVNWGIMRANIDSVSREDMNSAELFFAATTPIEAVEMICKSKLRLDYSNDLKRGLEVIEMCDWWLSRNRCHEELDLAVAWTRNAPHIQKLIKSARATCGVF